MEVPLTPPMLPMNKMSASAIQNKKIKNAHNNTLQSPNNCRGIRKYDPRGTSCQLSNFKSGGNLTNKVRSPEIDFCERGRRSKSLLLMYCSDLQSLTKL